MGASGAKRWTLAAAAADFQRRRLARPYIATTTEPKSSTDHSGKRFEPGAAVLEDESKEAMAGRSRRRVKPRGARRLVTNTPKRLLFQGKQPRLNFLKQLGRFDEVGPGAS